jgi:hypothetical protein
MLPGETILSGAPGHDMNAEVSELQVLRSAAGWYVGAVGTVICEDGASFPNTRDRLLSFRGGGRAGAPFVPDDRDPAGATLVGGNGATGVRFRRPAPASGSGDRRPAPASGVRVQTGHIGNRTDRGHG